MDQVPSICIVSNEINEEKEAVKEDLAVAEAKLASTDTKLADAHEEVSRVRQEEVSHQRSTSGASDTQRDRPSTLVHSIAHEAKYLKGASITRDEVSKFVSFLER